MMDKRVQVETFVEVHWLHTDLGNKEGTAALRAASVFQELQHVKRLPLIKHVTATTSFLQEKEWKQRQRTNCKM
jgi:hypothetical protein